MKVARAGQQSGNESTASANVVPRRASRRLTLGIFLTSVAASSSVITTRMFGRPSREAVAGRDWAVPVSAPAPTAVSAASAQEVDRLTPLRLYPAPAACAPARAAG